VRKGRTSPDFDHGYAYGPNARVGSATLDVLGGWWRLSGVGPADFLTRAHRRIHLIKSGGQFFLRPSILVLSAPLSSSLVSFLPLLRSSPSHPICQFPIAYAVPLPVNPAA